jgi:hypothetical protein
MKLVSELNNPLCPVKQLFRKSRGRGRINSIGEPVLLGRSIDEQGDGAFL